MKDEETQPSEREQPPLNLTEPTIPPSLGEYVIQRITILESKIEALQRLFKVLEKDLK